MGDLGVELRSYLFRQYQQGQLDSEGSFTIAAEEGLRKLAHFALPQEFDWVLKIVQAVNLWQTDALLVSQSRSATSFTFRPTSQPDPATLLSALSATALSTTNPVHTLAMALRSLVEQVGLSFVLAFRHNGVSSSPIYAGDDTSRLAPQVRDRWASLDQDGIRLTVSHFRSNESVTGRYLPTATNQPDRQKGIREVLCQEAVSSTVPIYLNGDRITDPARVPKLGYAPGFRPLRRVQLPVLDEESQATPRHSEDYPWTLRARELSSMTTIERNAPWFLVRSFDWDDLHRFVLFDPITRRFPPHKAPPHRILLSRQGVVCAAYSIANSSFGCTLTLVAPADHFRSDLLGLGLEIRQPETNQVRKWVGQAVEALKAYRLELDALLDSPPTLRNEHPTQVVPGEEPVGGSLFTDSLSDTRDRLLQRCDDLKDRLWHRTLSEQRRQALLTRWQKYVGEDLERVILDLQRRPMQLE